ncbi:MAG: IS66 family transposase zinc-finger binding domain-containing protein [Acidobacteriota bacterium]|nr:IS66 family transposase zinc-finger binding domain-containing protein [Acidobacteriota bacterium]
MLGPQSETLSNLQLELLADEEPGVTADEVAAEGRREPVAKMPPRERKPHPGRERLPENLPRVEKVIHCQERTCSGCGRETSVIGYDESERLDVEPARYFVRVIKREKRACGNCERGTVRMTPLDGWVMRVGELLQPVIAAMRKDLLSASYLQADERQFRCRCTTGAAAITKLISGSTASQAVRRSSISAWARARGSAKVSGQVGRHSADRRLPGLRRRGWTEDGACRLLGAWTRCSWWTGTRASTD